MDQNKLQKLKDIGYKIPKTCGTCKYFQMHVDEHFGECDKHSYVHLKHSGGKRKLSVVMHGSCNEHEVDDLSYLHGFKEFVCNPPGACSTHGRCWIHSEWSE